MTITKIDTIEPGNPFLSDPFNMGVTIGSNVTVMYANHSHEKQNYIIVVNTETGQRLKIEFTK